MNDAGTIAFVGIVVNAGTTTFLAKQWMLAIDVLAWEPAYQFHDMFHTRNLEAIV